MAGNNTGIDTAKAATTIMGPLISAAEISAERRETGKEYGERVNKATIDAYGQCVIVISGLMAQGLWTTGKQKKGVTSASAALSEAMLAEAKDTGVRKAKIKRLVEKAAAVLNGRTKIKEVVEAAKGGDGTLKGVLAAFGVAGIEREAQIIAHVDGERVSDPVDTIAKKYRKLDAEDRERLIEALKAVDEEGEEEEEAEEEAEETPAEKPKRGRKKNVATVSPGARGGRGSRAKAQDDPFA